MRTYLWCGLIVLVVAPVRAEAPPKAVKESWDAVYVEGFRCGYTRTAVVELERDGQKLYRTTLEMNMVMKRYGEVVRTRIESTVDETADGKVTGFTLTQFTDKGDKFTITGTVKDDKLLLKPMGDPKGKTVPWNAKAVGPYKQQRLLAEKKAKADDQFDYLGFEPALFAPVTTRVAVKPAEEVDVYEAKKDGDKLQFVRGKQKLLRVELRPDKVMIGETAMQLPTQVLWVDKDYAIVRSQHDFGLGKFILCRTTKEAATLTADDVQKMPDVGLNTKIPLGKVSDNIHEKSQAVYRVTIKDDNDPATVFVKDARQEVKNVKDGSFELHVRAVRAPAAVDKPGEAGKEFLESSYFIESGDATVKKHTAEAVGDEADAWKKAQRIEKWVHEHMHGSSDIGFATAGQVARDLRGDCRQHAMLTTAMCRAAGVPARTAIGLVYVHGEEGMEPFLGFHMWTEVWVKGQWLGLDATLGEGSIGPGHLKISDHSWHNTQTLAPVLPVLRVMGKAKVEVLAVK